MLKAVSGSWCRLELLASWSCFVERTTVNKLVNGKFTAPACGPIKPGDRGDDENDCDLCVCVCVMGMRRRRWRRGLQLEKGVRKVEGAGN